MSTPFYRVENRSLGFSVAQDMLVPRGEELNSRQGRAVSLHILRQVEGIQERRAERMEGPTEIVVASLERKR